jgi:5'-methylthioadenosine phosphorylase
MWYNLYNFSGEGIFKYMLGIIGGSGLYEIEGIARKVKRRIKTPFGDPSGSYTTGVLSGRKVAFLPRHGLQHSIHPHKVNYRANIWGFKELGVDRILSISAVGGISADLAPGAIVIPDQIIDMTSNRDATFYEGDSVVHIDFTEPYCPELRKSIIEASKTIGVEVTDSGTYVCVNGPRLETRAEIQFFARNGAHIVGMTAMPEAALAREVEICFGGIAIVTNYAAGIKKKSLRAKEVVEIMDATTMKLKGFLKEILCAIPQKRTCACRNVLSEATV